MRAVIQRVHRASVHVEGEAVGAIQQGLLVLLGIGPDEAADDLAWLVGRICTLRLFPEGDVPWARTVVEAAGGILVVSQFTLFASVKKGNRPSWHRAAKPDEARRWYEAAVADLSRALGKPVAEGKFGAKMEVDLINDGPVTLVLDSRARD